MKKILLLLLLTVCCQLGNAQNPFTKYKNVKDPSVKLFSFSWSEDARDAAYEAPTTKLTNKKWYHVGTYFVRGDLTTSIMIGELYEFNANGTGKYIYVTDNTRNNYNTIPFTWKRAKDNLTITLNYSQTTFVYDKEAMEGLRLKPRA